jgi:hypothetical protein
VVIPSHEMPEELVSILEAILEDDALSAWFLSLQQLPPAVRRMELGGLAARMRAAGEDADLAQAVSALARPELYDAACKTLRELVLEPQ